MTRHLNDEERIDALEGMLPVARQAHLDGCDGCRQSVAAMRDVLDDLVGAADEDVPEPSPLFWDHLHARVGGALAAEAEPATPWWRGSTRAWASLAAAALVVVVVAVGPWRSVRPEVPDEMLVEGAVDTIGDTIGESVQWQFVTDVLASFEPEMAHSVLHPSAAAVDAAFSTLTPDERDAFARLLQAELAEGSE
jgi:hypothetical protein